MLSSDQLNRFVEKMQEYESRVVVFFPQQPPTNTQKNNTDFSESLFRLMEQTCKKKKKSEKSCEKKKKKKDRKCADLAKGCQHRRVKYRVFIIESGVHEVTSACVVVIAV